MAATKLILKQVTENHLEPLFPLLALLTPVQLSLSQRRDALTAALSAAHRTRREPSRKNKVFSQCRRGLTSAPKSTQNGLTWPAAYYTKKGLRTAILEKKRFLVAA
jgi:glucose-6-phosphate 1-dehydrogenase